MVVGQAREWAVPRKVSIGLAGFEVLMVSCLERAIPDIDQRKCLKGQLGSFDSAVAVAAYQWCCLRESSSKSDQLLAKHASPMPSSGSLHGTLDANSNALDDTPLPPLHLMLLRPRPPGQQTSQLASRAIEVCDHHTRQGINDLTMRCT